METLSQIPKWFWIAIGAIVIVTIVAVVYCNKSSITNEAQLKENLGNSLTSKSGEDVFDSIAALQNMMNPTV